MKARLIEYNFERNIDPKKSMKMGMKEEVKEFMRSINKDEFLDNDHALIFASKYNRLDLVKWLIDPNGGDANKYANNDGPIRCAASYGNEEVAEYLLQFYRSKEILGIIQYCKHLQQRSKEKLKDATNRPDRISTMKQYIRWRKAAQLIEKLFKEKISK